VSGGLELDPSSWRVSANGRDISLRRKEFLILECLVRHTGTGLDRDYLRGCVWGEGKVVSNNSLDVHIKSLRDQLKQVGAENLITTIHGLGYMFNADRPKARS
jgi:DNA-binding response OmpR family regulator